MYFFILHVNLWHFPIIMIMIIIIIIYFQN